jgi:CheY-like chemotaxis protein
MLGLIDLLAADVRGEQGQKRLRSIQVAGCLLRDVLDRMSDVATSPLPRLASAEADGTVADREGRAAVMASAATSPAASVGARVLVAEDHAINQAVITEMLQHLGHVVEVVPDGRRAVQRVRDHLFDVVLMDWSMPEVDGVEATRQIRAEEARTGRQRVPIIALTAHTYAENRRECLEAGMDDFVAKPVTVDVLDAAIRRAVA